MPGVNRKAMRVPAGLVKHLGLQMYVSTVPAIPGHRIDSFRESSRKGLNIALLRDPRVSCRSQLERTILRPKLP